MHVLEVKGGFPHCMPVLTIRLSLEEREDRASTPLPRRKGKARKKNFFSIYCFIITNIPYINFIINNTHLLYIYKHDH